LLNFRPIGGDSPTAGVQFFMRSNYPLSVFSTLRTPGQIVMPAQVGLQGFLKPSVSLQSYTYNGTPIPNGKYDTSTLLSVVNGGPLNQVFFSSVITPQNNISWDEQTYTESRNPYANGIVYLSFIIDGYTYSFGLRMNITGAAMLSDGTIFSNGASEFIQLVCLSSQCAPDSNSIVWNDVNGKVTLKATANPTPSSNDFLVNGSASTNTLLDLIVSKEVIGEDGKITTITQPQPIVSLQ